MFKLSIVRQLYIEEKNEPNSNKKSKIKITPANFMKNIQKNALLQDAKQKKYYQNMIILLKSRAEAIFDLKDYFKSKLTFCFRFTKLRAKFQKFNQA